MSDPCGRASSSFFVRGLTVRIASSAKHLHLTVELRPSPRPSFGYRAKLCVPVCQGGDIVARPSAVLRGTVSSKALCTRLPCREERCSRGCQYRKVSGTFRHVPGANSCSCPPPGTLRTTLNIKIAQHLRLEGVRGPRLHNQSVANLWGRGPTHFLHFDCAISAPRRPLDT